MNHERIAPRQPARLLFLPGALGRIDFWEPCAASLAHPASKRILGWPSFGPTPPDPRVRGIDDLVDAVCAQLDQPSALVAQSMGGVIALRAALRKPGLVTHLVLSATSGGLATRALGAEDWRAWVRDSHPMLPDWFLTHDEDMSASLPAINIPTLLLWGDADPISPVAVGQRLAALLPRAALHVFAGADHDLGFTHAAEAAALIDRHLAGD